MSRQRIENIGAYPNRYRSLVDKTNANFTELYQLSSPMIGVDAPSPGTWRGSGPEMGVPTAAEIPESPNPNWVAGTYSLANYGLAYSVTVDGSGNATVSIDGPLYPAELGVYRNTFVGPDLGGVDPDDNFTLDITAIAVVNPPAIDLTQELVFLNMGWYTLADGYEGQRISFVPGTDQFLAIMNTVYVMVEKVNPSGNEGNMIGIVQSNRSVEFFDEYNSLVTAIFANGGWCFSAYGNQG